MLAAGHVQFIDDTFASSPLTQPRSASLNIRVLHRKPSIVFGTMSPDQKLRFASQRG
jgi:hypothetical protein